MGGRGGVEVGEGKVGKRDGGGGVMQEEWGRRSRGEGVAEM